MRTVYLSDPFKTSTRSVSCEHAGQFILSTSLAHWRKFTKPQKSSIAQSAGDKIKDAGDDYDDADDAGDHSDVFLGWEFDVNMMANNIEGLFNPE